MAAKQAKDAIIKTQEVVIHPRDVKKVLRETILIQLKCLKESSHIIETPTYFRPPEVRKFPDFKKQKHRRPTSPNFFSSSSYCTSNFYSAQQRFFSTAVPPTEDTSMISSIKNLNPKEHFEFVLSGSKPIEISKEFNEHENLIEFDESTDWDQTVIKSELPTVIDCYADWCGPCKKLMPLLKKRFSEQKNFRLVKINIDKNQELAEKLNIQSIPAVFLVYKGNVVDQFLGLPDTKRLDEFFSNLNIIQGMGKDEGIFQSLIVGADEWMKKKDFTQAENMLNEASTHQNWQDKYGYIIKLGLAISNFHRKEYSKALFFTNSLTELNKPNLLKDALANRKVAIIEVHSKLRSQEIEIDEAKFLEKMKVNPKDLESIYVYAKHLIKTEKYGEAITKLLEIVKADKAWEDKKANKLLVSVFNLLGSESKLTVEGRKNLTKLLY